MVLVTRRQYVIILQKSGRKWDIMLKLYILTIYFHEYINGLVNFSVAFIRLTHGV